MTQSQTADAATKIGTGITHYHKLRPANAALACGYHSYAAPPQSSLGETEMRFEYYGDSLVRRFSR